MIAAWLIELATAIGKLFFNPLLYWSIILVLVVGYKRIKAERKNFGLKVYDMFAEWKHTLGLAIGIGIFMTALNLGIGMVFSYEMIVLLTIVIICLSLTFRLSLLSSSYTIGISYLLLLIMPMLIQKQPFLPTKLFSNINFTGLTTLLGFFLLTEAYMLNRLKSKETFPELVQSDRGRWVGQHRLKKLVMVPFFTLVPTGMISSFAPFWPYLPLGNEETYSLVLVPFLFGFDYAVRGNLPSMETIKLSKQIFGLALIVILLAVGSIFIAPLSLVAVVVAILGREFINFKHRVKDREKKPYFYQSKQGIQVLGIIPGTPADRLQVLIGETITKVNGIKISNETEFYRALQESGASFKIDVLDHNGEVRFVQSAIYAGDHHELGFLFVGEPYRTQKM